MSLHLATCARSAPKMRRPATLWLVFLLLKRLINSRVVFLTDCLMANASWNLVLIDTGQAVGNQTLQLSQVFSFELTIYKKYKASFIHCSTKKVLNTVRALPRCQKLPLSQTLFQTE